MTPELDPPVYRWERADVADRIVCRSLRRAQERAARKNTIPDQIVSNRVPYFNALEAADQSSEAGRVDLGKMEELLEGMLAVQLKSMMEDATNKTF